MVTKMKRVVLFFSLIFICRTNDDLHQITLMTYNVMFLPSILVFERDQITRAHLLTKAKFIYTNDILCLQEVFQTKPSEILLHALNQTYSYSTPILGNEDHKHNWNERWNDHVGEYSLKFVGGGVIILSKWPIVYTIEYLFNHACSAHRFVRTGFVYAKILYGQSRYPIHVFGTHLQPNDYRGCYLQGEDKIREQQMQEINTFIQTRNLSKDELVFILGDFNIDKYHTQQYENMLDIFNLQSQTLYPTSIPCSWDSSYNAMTNARHGSQLLDYIFLVKNHAPKDVSWFNLIIDRMASKQWHSLGSHHRFYNSKNLPLIELSDHYPVVGFFNRSKQSWSLTKQSGVITYVQLVTVDTNLPVIIVNREVRLGQSSNETGSIFLLTNNGTPRRHRCLRSEQYVLLIDGRKPEFYLSDERYLRMKYGKEHVNRFLKIIQLDQQSNCIRTNSTIIFQSRLPTGYFYIKNQNSSLCSCANRIDQAQTFRLIEIERKNISCTVTY